MSDITYRRENHRDGCIEYDEITLGELLDMWVEEDLVTGALSNGTVELYRNIVRLINRHPIRDSKINAITPEELQEFMDMLSFGGRAGDFDSHNGYSKTFSGKFATVLNHAFRFAVYQGKYIESNPMQNVLPHRRASEEDIFSQATVAGESVPVLTKDKYEELIAYLSVHHPDAMLPVQIAYYTGLRIGEVFGLVWHDINLREQYLTIRRSVSYSPHRHRIQIGTAKFAKIRTVDFGDNLTGIFIRAKNGQKAAKKDYGIRYHDCYYNKVMEKSRIYYEYYHMDKTVPAPDSYHMVDFVCRRRNGVLMRPDTMEAVCRHIANTLPGFENFHFHVLRHTYTTNLLTGGAAPKDVQELLGHSSISTTMNIYAHATRESKRQSVRILDGLNCKSHIPD